MRKFLLNNGRIIYRVFFLMFFITIISISNDFKGVDGIILIILGFILNFSVAYLVNKLFNRKINKLGRYMLEECNPDPYINLLEKELQLVNQNKNPQKYEELKCLLIYAKIYKYGLTEKIVKEFKEIDINKLSNYSKKKYNMQLAMIYIKENNDNEYKKIINSFDLKKDKLSIEYIKQIAILNSKEKINQEKYFLENNELYSKADKYRYLSSVFNLAKYYYKMENYDIAKIYFEYLKKYGNKVYFTEFAKEYLNKMKEKKIKFNTNKNDIENIEKNLRNDNYKSTNIILPIFNFIFFSISCIIICFYSFVLFKINSIEKEEFIKYMKKYTCNVVATNDNFGIDNIINHYSTDDKCNFEVGLVEFNNKNVYQNLINNINSKYNLKPSLIFSSGFERETVLEGNYFNELYYIKVYEKDNTILYAITSNKYIDDVNQVFTDLRYTKKYYLKTLFK